MRCCCINSHTETHRDTQRHTEAHRMRCCCINSHGHPMRHRDSEKKTETKSRETEGL